MPGRPRRRRGPRWTRGGFLNLQAAQQTRTLSMTPATGGETTSRTELASNTLAPSTVLGMVSAVDPAYKALGAKWYMSDQQLLGLRAQLDAYGRPYYPSLYDPKPTLIGYDVVIDQNISALTASTISGPVFGHLQSRWFCGLSRAQGCSGFRSGTPTSCRSATSATPGSTPGRMT